MNQKTIDKYKATIEATKRYYKPHHTRWQRLIEDYDLEYQIGGYGEEEIVKVSLFITTVRKIIASVAYNSPKIFIKVTEEPKDEAGVSMDNIGEILTRAANDILNRTYAKEAVHRAIFNTLFKYRGILKVSLTPPKSQAEPYFFDTAQPDFISVKCIPTENVFIDPFLEDSQIENARYIFEEMFVPLEQVKDDPRYEKRGNLKPYIMTDSEIQTQIANNVDPLFPTTEFEASDKSEQIAAIMDLMRTGEYVKLIEYHDRINRRRLTFANDIPEPIENIESPFLYLPQNLPPATAEPAPLTNKFTALFQNQIPQPTPTPEQQIEDEKIGQYITPSPFPYFGMTFDIANRFMGKPLMSYQNSLQQIIVRSLTRRSEILDRGKTVVFVSRTVTETDEDFIDDFANARDGEVMEIADVNEVKEVQVGRVPNDQKGLEADARIYNQDLSDVGVGIPHGTTETATEASAAMSVSELNRRWFQSSTQDGYKFIIDTAFSLFSQYPPERWFIDTSKDGEPTNEQVLQSWWLNGRYDTEIISGSGSVLVEQLNRADSIELYGILKDNPKINQKNLLEMLISSFNVTEAHDLFISEENPEALSNADNENELLFRNIPVEALPEQDHQAHIEAHMAGMEDAQQLAQSGQIAGQVLQMIEQHIQQHEMFLQEQTENWAGDTPPARPQGKTAGSDGIISTVQSNAQRLSRAVRDKEVENANV